MLSGLGSKRRQVCDSTRNDAELANGRAHRKNEKGVLRYLWRPAAIATLWELTRGGGMRMEAIGAYTTVEDRELLDVPGRPTVLHLPGHTKGSIGFFLPERHVCFSGDALVTLNLLTSRRGPSASGRGLHGRQRGSIELVTADQRVRCHVFATRSRRTLARCDVGCGSASHTYRAKLISVPRLSV